MKRKENHSGGEKENGFRYKPFFYFDIIHILTAVYFIVFAFAENADVSYEASVGFTEILFSLALIVFADFIAEGKEAGEEALRYYSFAWMLAAAGLAVPALCSIPFLAANETSVASDTVFGYGGLILSLLALASFVCSAVLAPHNKKQSPWLFLGMLFVSLLVLLELASTIFFPETEDIGRLILSIIKEAAPAIPLAFGFIDLAKAKNDI